MGGTTTVNARLRVSLLAFLSLSVLSVLILRGASLFDWVLYRTEFYETHARSIVGAGDYPGAGEPVRGWRRVKRIGERDRFEEGELWYVSTGFMYMRSPAVPASAYKSGNVRPTHWPSPVSFWHKHGEIFHQFIPDNLDHPPWHAGVTDQEKPSAPWLLEGRSAEDWWAHTKHAE